MNRLERIPALEEEDFAVESHNENSIALRGTLSLRNPSDTVGVHFKQVHLAVSGTLEEFFIDVSALKFMNSSAIRLFVDWIEWSRQSERPYVLHFRTDPRVTWQRNTFNALKALGSNLVRVSIVRQRSESV